MEGGERRRHQRADDSAGRVVRLDAREIYAGAGAISVGAGSVFAFVPRGVDLSRPVHGELVSTLPDGDQRPGSSAQRANRESVAYPLSGGGIEGISSGGHDAAGNDAGGYGGSSASGGRALRASGGQDGDAAADEPGN